MTETETPRSVADYEIGDEVEILGFGSMGNLHNTTGKIGVVTELGSYVQVMVDGVMWPYTPGEVKPAVKPDIILEPLIEITPGARVEVVNYAGDAKHCYNGRTGEVAEWTGSYWAVAMDGDHDFWRMLLNAKEIRVLAGPEEVEAPEAEEPKEAERPEGDFKVGDHVVIYGYTVIGGDRFNGRAGTTLEWTGSFWDVLLDEELPTDKVRSLLLFSGEMLHAEPAAAAAEPLTFEAYVDATDETAIYPEAGTGSMAALAYVTLGLLSEAGEIAGKVKKIMRDNDGIVSHEASQNLLKEAGDTFYYMGRLVKELDARPMDVLQGNLDKLRDRKDRGVLQGSGDNR